MAKDKARSQTLTAHISCQRPAFLKVPPEELLRDLSGGGIVVCQGIRAIRGCASGVSRCGKRARPTLSGPTLLRVFAVAQDSSGRG